MLGEVPIEEIVGLQSARPHDAEAIPELPEHELGERPARALHDLLTVEPCHEETRLVLAGPDLAHWAPQLAAHCRLQLALADTSAATSHAASQLAAGYACRTCSIRRCGWWR